MDELSVALREMGIEIVAVQASAVAGLQLRKLEFAPAVSQEILIQVQVVAAD